MVVSGKFDSMSLSLDGKLKITFSVSEKEKALREVEEIKDVEKLDITAEKHRSKRSLDANAYFWVLCDKIAKRLGSSTYNTKEMSDLIHGTVSDAGSLGIDTATPEEVERMLAIWKGSSNMKNY